MTRPPKDSLVQILAIENRWVRLAEICNHIIGKIDQHGAACLTPVERTIDRVNDFEYRMIRGGLSGLLYSDWLDWKAIAEVVAALEVVGATEASRLLRETLVIVAGAVERQPLLRARDGLTWGDLLALVDPTHQIERIEREIAPHVDGINQHLLSYVESHQVDLLRADETTA
ncbi:MAG TPA: hypothetical protein VFH68_09825 [Polyangia bacterium]|jgi:hypothetical protein|nr:hypothetical protein [Polyangia bacterium]